MAQNDSPNPEFVAWVEFPDKRATIKRLVLPDGRKGIFVTTQDSDLGREVVQKGIDFGLTPLKSGNNLRVFFENGKATFTPAQLAQALGGRLVKLTYEDLVSEKWTISISKKMINKANTTPEAPKKVVEPDHETVRRIGLNMRGDVVFEDKDGRYVQQHNTVSGDTSYVFEDAALAASLFLRAHRREDLPAIAAGIVASAKKTVLNQETFDSILDAALAAGPSGAIDIDRAEAAEVLRTEMIRQVTAVAIEGDAKSENFSAALRMSSATNQVLSRPTVAGEALSPSMHFLSFMRRAARGVLSVDARVSGDLSLVLPRNRTDSGAFQIHDLAEAGENAGAFALNVLGRRDLDGRSIFILPGSASTELAERVRSDIGVAYAIDTVAEIAPAIADGLQDAMHRTVFFVGDRRPEALESLPQAVMRTFQVVTSDDLLNLEREILRSRGRISAFHRGIEENADEALDDSRAENERQRPYQPLSRTGTPFTMVPVALEGALYGALDRLRNTAEDRGGVDAMVSNALGMGVDMIGSILTPEQIDTIALRMERSEVGRGFLLADQTGIGKGRSLAAMGRAHLRAHPDNKVFYVTESGPINVPDVCRDLHAVGAFNEAKVAFLSAKSHFSYEDEDNVTGDTVERELHSMTNAQRKALFESGEWLDNTNVIITTYSQFSTGAEDVRSQWLATAIDDRTMIIFDEAHNALNGKSNMGRNMRVAIEATLPENVVYGSATPSRDPSGMNLYKPLLPRVEDGRLDALLDDMSKGGEVGQEAFATMMAADGVMMRRDHDLSNLEFVTAMPDDNRMLSYQRIMGQFAPVVEMMIDVNLKISEQMGRRQGTEFRNAVNRGMDEQAARSLVNGMNQYSIALGSPLSNLARIMMNALKIDQMVDETLAEIREGRKPLITFHSTNAAVLNEMARGDDGKLSEEAMENANGLSIKDQIRRIHNSIYKIKLEDEPTDARVEYGEVADAAALVEAAINDLPDDLPVSPLDSLIERLEANGLTVGEISGRTLCYRNDRIQKRTGTDRRETINGFNGGDIDVMLFNAAGATGGSFHASADFADQSPRTLIEWEPPTNIIKYVQGLGRANRYGQVAKPRVKSVMTGLISEMKIEQQKNAKLRSLGASVDGNRQHPMLMEKVPDLLNPVGDEAARNVLASMPTYARRMGFEEFIDAEDQEGFGLREQTDTGSGSHKSGLDSLANKVMTRALVLSSTEQADVVQRIVMEFEALIEELDSRNANPLKPKMLVGRIEMVATSVFSGDDSGDVDASAFTSPLYISTGIHHFDEEAWTGDKLVEAVEGCRRLYGSEGFSLWAERLKQKMPLLLRSRLPEGMTMEDALAAPGTVSPHFAARHSKLEHFIWILENLKPGVNLSLPAETADMSRIRRIVVGLIPPSDSSHADVASAYKIDVISPGGTRPERISLSRLMSYKVNDIAFRNGISEGLSETYLDAFDNESQVMRSVPVQIMHGNTLQAISTAAKFDLGSISLYRNADGQIMRGVVVKDSKIDMSMLPIDVPSAAVAAELAFRHIENRLANNEFEGVKRNLRIVGSMEDTANTELNLSSDIWISIGAEQAVVDMVPLRKSNREWYVERPGLYEALTGEAMPSAADTKARQNRKAGFKHAGRFTFDLKDANDSRKLVDVIHMMSGANLIASGHFRPHVNEIVADMDRMRGAPERVYTHRAVEDAVIVDAETPEAPAPVAARPARAARAEEAAAAAPAAAAPEAPVVRNEPAQQIDDAPEINTEDIADGMDWDAVTDWN
jgi:hypothetical protein